MNYGLVLPASLSPGLLRPGYDVPGIPYVDFFESLHTDFAACSQPPASRDNHRKASYQRLQQRDQVVVGDQDLDRATRVVVKTILLLSWPRCRQLLTVQVKSSLFYQTLKVRRKESVKRPFGHLSQLHLQQYLTVIGVNLNLAINHNTK